MTVQESTICSLIQTFPVLLILAQNHNRCVKTPLIYKPPSPTHSPEYYQALDALIHNLYGHHGNHHDSSYHDHDPGYLCYGYNEGKHSEYGYGHSGFGTPCYNYGYVTTGHGIGHDYPHSFGYSNHGQQYPGYGFKKINGYNGTSYGVKGYAPNQVYNLNHKYKVVVKRNKVRHRRKFQKLIAGFFESQPREERRYSSQGFSHNHVPRHNRYRNQVSGTLHVRPENQNSNQAYVYPFDQRRGISSPGYYDQYGNYQQNQYYPGYEGQNYNPQGQNYYPQGQNYYPQGQNYPDYSRTNYPQNQNYPYYGEYNNNMPVRFPTSNIVSNNNDRTAFVVQEVPAIEPRPEENVIANQDKNSEYTAEDNGVNFPNRVNLPAKENEEKYNGGSPDVPLNTEATTLPPLTPVPPSEVQTAVPQLPSDPSSAVISSPSDAEVPAFKPDSDKNSDGISASKPFSPPETSEADLPPLKPVESSDPNQGFSSFIPESPQSDLTPLQPVVQSNNGFSQNKPDSPQPIFPPLQPVEPSNPDNGFPSFKPVSPQESFPPLQPVNPGEQTRLPPLTPVPTSEMRNSFNFGGAESVFQAPCQTVEGDHGSCVSIYDCQPYLVRLQQSRSDPGIIQVLRRAHCGFDGNNPKVCCPRPGIPTAEPDIPTFPPVTTTTTSTTTTTTAKPTTAKPNATCPPETYSVAPEDKLPRLPEPPVCGLSNASFSRVVGGVDAHLGDFPFMALLGYKNKRNSTSWLCGGSLITSKHVLTAAHCIKCKEDQLYVVRLGELDLSRDDEGATPVDVLVKTHVIHKGYSTNTFTNDIGLLVLQNEVQFTSLIRPLCIPRSPELRSLTFERYTPMIAGWGDLHFRGPQSQILQVLQLPVVSNDDCKQSYVKYKSQVIDERVLCAGYKLGGRDACQGDSGGPLMQPIARPDLARINGNPTYFYQIGVVSYGYKCAEPNFPGVYTRVTYFVPWLEQQLLSTR